MDHKPTIYDVAKLTGVSKSTVSLVLQNSPLVKGETRERVLKTMEKVGYVYNRAAAKLRTEKTGLIALVINDLRNPFFTEFAVCVQAVLAERGYAAVLANTDEDPDVQDRVIRALIEHGVSAFILSPSYDLSDNNPLAAIERAGLPAIQALRQIDHRGDLFPFIAPDYEACSRLATQHLIDQGAQKIAFVGGIEDRPVTQERMKGYLAVLEEAGLQSTLLTGAATRAFGRQAAQQLHLNHPEVDGVLCFNDLVSLGVADGCQETGRTVGTEVRIVGIDDIEACASNIPSLSSVRCNIPEFARTVAEDLLAWLNDGKIPPPIQRRSVDLVIRRSSTGS